MKVTQLYQHLEKDFITPEMSDEWAQYMDSVADFLSENFKKRSMGLVKKHKKTISENQYLLRCSLMQEDQTSSILMTLTGHASAALWLQPISSSSVFLG